MISIINPRSNWYRADLNGTSDGVSVRVWKAIGDARNIDRLVSQEVLDCPFHLACDRVYTLLGQLPNPNLELINAAH
jgi:hypothetical protein